MISWFKRALAVTGTKKYREAFEPLIGGTVFAQYNNLEDVEDKITERTCAIILETIQGEGGIYPADKQFLNGVAKICKEKDILLILDEIQCGMGRTGTMFAYEQYKIIPDIITSAKALGCGVPVGAFAAAQTEVSNSKPCIIPNPRCSFIQELFCFICSNTSYKYAPVYFTFSKTSCFKNKSKTALTAECLREE